MGEKDTYSRAEIMAPRTDEPCVLAKATAVTPYARRPIATGELRASRDGISIGGVLIAARSEIKSANLWPSQRFGTFVCIRKRGLRSGVDVQVAGLEEGRAVLHALGFDAT